MKLTSFEKWYKNNVFNMYQKQQHKSKTIEEITKNLNNLAMSFNDLDAMYGTIT